MEGSGAEKDVKAPNLLERAKEEFDAMTHKEKIHDKETHGKSNDIDEDTPVDKVKGPSVFERAKEEIEALVETIHPKKVTDSDSPSKKKEEGFWVSLGSKLDRCCNSSKKA